MPIEAELKARVHASQAVMQLLDKRTQARVEVTGTRTATADDSLEKTCNQLDGQKPLGRPITA